jgi:hypothetical protein
MMLRQGKNSVLRQGAYVFALLAVFARVFVPAGLMPGIHGSGPAFSLVICTGFGALSLQLENDQDPVNPDSGKSHGDKPCAFAGTVAAGEPNSFSLWPPAPAKVSQFAALRSLELGKALQGKQSHPRAPPVC